MLAAAAIAHDAGRTVACTRSESLCIGDRREGVWGMIESGTVDLLVGNEDEVSHLTRCGRLSDCIESLSSRVKTLVITRGALGDVAVSNGTTAAVEAAPVEQVIDTTGAGALFAAGFISAHCRGHDLAGSLMAGSRAAAEVIAHFGARPERD